MTERGRSTQPTSGESKKRSMFRSRSRSRKSKSGDDKPSNSRWKKGFKAMSFKGSRSTKTDSVVSEPPPQSDPVPSQAPADKKASATKAVTPEPPKTEAPSLQLVLLLMEPQTRRFELLQLEFDSARARVIDVLAQVPLSVTEDAIKEQEYDGVIAESGELMQQGKLLVEFCKKKQVLVALPKDFDIKECTRLARPILSDQQVSKMLSTSGFEVSEWQAVEIESDSNNKGVKRAGRGITGVLFAVAFVAILAILVQATHKYLMQPIEAGVPLPPGSIRSKCGLLGYLPNLGDLELHQCNNSYLEVNNDGTASVYGEDRELSMLLVGSTCDDSEDCVDGVLVEDDGSVYIGGQRVKTAQVYQDEASLSPWPFQESPKMKTKRLRAKK